MSIYRRDKYDPEWEPFPWDAGWLKTGFLERGFHKRALKNIRWEKIQWDSFPCQGLFGHPKGWYQSIDASYYATHENEDLILIENIWFGWPDPPQYGLISRLEGSAKWKHWGNFSEVPDTWKLPRL